MRAWERSKTDTTRRRQSRTLGGGTIAELVIETEHGDPRYLEQARKALADLRKLWGLEASTTTNVHIAQNPYADLSDEEVHERLIKSAERVLELDKLCQATPPPAPPDASPASSPPDSLEARMKLYEAELERRKQIADGS
jgi:hypothetical protein